LIAHELAHVVQQAHGGATPDAEARADGAAARAMRGGSVDAAALGGAPTGVQTKPDEPATAPAEKAPDVITGADVPVRSAAAPTATILDGFVRDKARLTKRHRDAIEQIAFAIWLELSLHADAKATIAISGHTDTTAGDKHNSGLSTERAENAKAALEAALRKQEIDPAKLGPITATGHGETKLRVATGDEVDEPGNRRVEIEVTIEVKAPAPSPDAPTPTKPLPGMPGGPKIWEVPGLMDELDPGGPPTIPRAPKSKGEWLEEALKRDPLLKKLPKWAREKAIGALKDADEKAAEAIIDAVPFDDEYKQAAKAAMKALLQTLKGRKFKPPPEPPRGIPEDMLKTPGFPKAPGEMIFKLPPIRF
jgi:outer membrane protein OmpA-like peptidoglycan-associated protein